MYLLARGRTRTGVRTGNVRTCPCSYSYWYLLCSALLDSTGNVPTCPCSYSYWYLLCSASLGQHGQCTYLPVVVLVLVSARVMYLLPRVRTRTGTSYAVLCWRARAMYLLALVRTRTGTSCAVLRLESTVNVPTCPWSYSYWCRTGNVPTSPCSYSYWYLLCSALLGQHGQCTWLPVVVLVLVPLVQCFAWTARAMHLCARACILVQCLCSASHGQCTYLPVVVVHTK